MFALPYRAFNPTPCADFTPVAADSTVVRAIQGYQRVRLAIGAAGPAVTALQRARRRRPGGQRRRGPGGQRRGGPGTRSKRRAEGGCRGKRGEGDHRKAVRGSTRGQARQGELRGSRKGTRRRDATCWHPLQTSARRRRGFTGPRGYRRAKGAVTHEQPPVLAVTPLPTPRPSPQQAPAPGLPPRPTSSSRQPSPTTHPTPGPSRSVAPRRP